MSSICRIDVYINGKQQNTYGFTRISKNPSTNVLRRIVTMILHTTSRNFVILNDKLLIENGKKSNADYFSLSYGHS